MYLKLLVLVPHFKLIILYYYNTISYLFKNNVKDVIKIIMSHIYAINFINTKYVI